MSGVEIACLSVAQLRLLDAAIMAEMLLRAAGVAHDAEVELEDGFLTVVMSSAEGAA